MCPFRIFEEIVGKEIPNLCSEETLCIMDQLFSYNSNSEKGLCRSFWYLMEIKPEFDQLNYSNETQKEQQELRHLLVQKVDEY